VASLPKSPTGIDGFDEVTGGGLPTGRPTLVCGAAGCGKTLFALHFLVHGITRFDEPGVFMSFEESVDELAQNVASLDFDLPRLIKDKKLVLDHVKVERSEIEETGDYDLDQIFAVPTLVRRLPEPIRKIIGDLSNTERVLVGLDLREA